MLVTSAVLSINSEFFRPVFMGEAAMIVMASIGFVSEKLKLHIGLLGLP